MINPANKDRIIAFLALGIICTGITAFSLGCATGFALSKSVRIQVGVHD